MIVLSKCFIFYMSETAVVNIQLDSHAVGDVYRFIYPLRTFVAFHKWRKKFFKCKKETA